MAALPVFGTTITFNSSYFSAKITAVNLDGYSREALDTTHTTSTNGWETNFLSKIQKVGEAKVTILYDPDTSPPLTSAAETITITFPIPTGKTNGATFACSGGMTDFSFKGELKGLYMADCTLTFSGEPTWTPSS